MRRAVFLALTGGAALIPRVTGAAQPPRVAIITAAEGAVAGTDAERFAARLGHGILQHPGFELVTRERLSAALAEQGLSHKAYADPATSAKLGRVIGASHILHVTLTLDENPSNGTLVKHDRYDVASDYELIEVATARITANGTAGGSEDREAPGGGDFTESASAARRAAIDACAEDLISQLPLA